MEGGRATPSWALSQLSVPPGVDWWDSDNGYFQGINFQGTNVFNYYEDDTSCSGTYIYMIESDVRWSHVVRRMIHFPFRDYEAATDSFVFRTSPEGHMGICQELTSVRTFA